MLVSLDTGHAESADASVNDLEPSRMIYGNNVPDGDTSDHHHGHNATSIFSAAGNNGNKIAGINWVSEVRVEDLYGTYTFSIFGIEIISHKTSLKEAIDNAVAYANAHRRRAPAARSATSMGCDSVCDVPYDLRI